MSRKFTKVWKKGHKRVTDICTGDEVQIPLYQIPIKSKNEVWIAKGAPRPTILRPGFGIPKAFFTIYINAAGLVFCDMMPKGQTMNSTYFTKKIVTGVAKGISKTKRTRGLNRTQILHDNASSHKSRLTTQKLESMGLSVIRHPPYSPDLAICDFWLFMELKNRLAGKRFKTRAALAKSVNRELKNIPQSEYRKSFENWLIRLKKCIDAGGDYFEGQ